MTKETRPAEFQFLIARHPEPIPCLAMTLEEAGRAVGLSAQTMRTFVVDGRLKAKRTSEAGRFLVTPDDLKKWFDRLPDA